MSIKAAIFYVESVAHLQGKESILLPMADKARAEHKALIYALEAMVTSFHDIEYIGGHNGHKSTAIKMARDALKNKIELYISPAIKGEK
jgi:hypothetical protein